MKLILHLAAVAALATPSAAHAEKLAIQFAGVDERTELVRSPVLTHLKEGGHDVVDVSGQRDEFGTFESHKLYVSPDDRRTLGDEPPTFLPSEVATAWRAAVEGCRHIDILIGDPDPTRPTFCQMRAGETLWREYLLALDAQRLITISVVQSGKDRDTVNVRLTATSLGKAGTWQPDEVATKREKAAKNVIRALDRLLSGKVDFVPARRPPLPLPQPASEPAMAGGQLVEMGGVIIPRGCGAALPRSLELRPADNPAAETLARAWQKTVSFHSSLADPWVCDFVASAPPSAPAFFKVRSVLQCGEDRRFEQAGFGNTAEDVTARHEIVTGLIQQLLAHLCGE